MRIEYHRTLVADRVRNEAFEAALRAHIVPGETVVADIGAGTGLLGVLAHKLGARDVFLYECAEVAGIAEQVLKANKARNCHLIPFSSREMDDPPQVDLVVSETLGNYPFEEDIIATLNDALKRHLKPGGKIVPKAIRQYVAPVISPAFHDELTVWRNVIGEIDFSCAEHLSLNNVYVRTVSPAALLGGSDAAVQWDSVIFDRQNKSARKGQVSWQFDQPVSIFGFATWWQADLGGGICLSTAPDAPSTHWEQLYYPLCDRLDAVPGSTVRLSLRSQSSPEAGTHLAWTATLENSNGEVITRHAHDLDKGYLP